MSGDTIILDGTTMDELEKYHATTLRLCVATVKEQEQATIEREVDEIADRIRFDE